VPHPHRSSQCFVAADAHSSSKLGWHDSGQSSQLGRDDRNPIQAQQGSDLIILCHSVSAREQAAIGAKAERLNTKIYALTGFVQPEHFISKVRELAAMC
jgi:hypothetical protein